MTKTVYPGSTTDRAAQIRAAFKAKGWTSRDISVRAEYYSMGSSIHVVIKNPDVPFEPVERAANEHERIDRCEYSGEILSGGNRFVHVSYSTEARAILTARYADVVNLAKAELDARPDSNCLIPIGSTTYMLGRGNNGWGYSLWGDGGHIQTANEAECLASLVAIKEQDDPTHSHQPAPAR